MNLLSVLVFPLDLGVLETDGDELGVATGGDEDASAEAFVADDDGDSLDGVAEFDGVGLSEEVAAEDDGDTLAGATEFDGDSLGRTTEFDEGALEGASEFDGDAVLDAAVDDIEEDGLGEALLPVCWTCGYEALES